MSKTQPQEIELGAQVTTPYGVGVVTWVEVGGDEFRVLMYEMGPELFSPRTTVVVDRDHIAFWPPRKPEEVSRG